MKTKLVKNLQLQTCLQFVNILIPLATTPYIARVLGANNTGIFSFATSNASYFTLFAMMGTIAYGTREIADAKARNNRITIFNEIYALQLICVFICSITYMMYSSLIEENNLICRLQIITLIGYGFDISWYYYGIEDFRSTVVLSLIYRLIGCISIFCLVKHPADLWIYTVIMLGSAALNQFTIWLLAVVSGKIRFSKTTWNNVKKHIRPNVLLFIPLIAMTINHNVDKTMLGIFSTFDQVGYYYNVEKIISVPYGVITGIGTVLLPRMTVLFKDKGKKANGYFNAALGGMMMAGIAFSFGILSVSKEFVPFFLGDGYDACINLINVFTPVLLIKCLSNSISNFLLIPCKMEKVYIKSSLIGATINIIINTVLIPEYGAFGAEIATIISESIALIVQIYYVNNLLDKKNLMVDASIYCINGVMMFLTVRLISAVEAVTIVRLAIETITGAFVFCILSVMYWKISGRNQLVLLLRGKRNQETLASDKIEGGG